MALAKHLDPDKNGFIEFKDFFSAKFKPNLPHLLGTKSEFEDNNSEWGGNPAPNAQMMRKQDLLCRKASQTYREMDKRLRPDAEQKPRRTT